MDQRWSGFRSLLLVSFCGVLALCVMLALQEAHEEFEAVVSESAVHDEGKRVQPLYLGSAACFDCHEVETTAWRMSDHAQAMGVATPENVLGEFDGSSLEHHGLTSTMLREGDRFYFETDGPDGVMGKYEAKHTFGYDPLQQYLVEFPDGRIQTQTIAWDSIRNEWFHLYADEPIDSDDPLHWTNPLFNWNFMCAECHTVNLQKNYDGATNTYATTFAEAGVGCESCHGPGSRHVRLAEAESEVEEKVWGGDARMGLTVQFFESDTNQKQIDACAPCHSRRMPIASGFTPGDRFLDHYSPELLEPELYYVDGQIRDEVFVYGSFLQSRMYREGVRCSDCHDSHTMKPKRDGNALCLDCHDTKLYDTIEHHFHEPNTQAALCIECHMPERTYMVVDPRRDHNIRNPRPDLSIKYGTPNVCTGCHDHAQETDEWAVWWIVEWYGEQRMYDPHYAEALQAGRDGDVAGIEPLRDIFENEEDYSPMVRATAISLFGRFGLAEPKDVLEGRITALSDPHPLVRSAAVRAMDQTAPLDAILTHVVPRLGDESRLVRTEAAWIVAGRVDRQLLSEQNQIAFDQAIEEYRQIQYTNSDRPASHLNLGVLNTDMNRLDEAVKDYKNSLRIDPVYLPGRYNLALLHYRRGERDLAETQLHEIVSINEQEAEAWYYLGLLVAEDASRLEEAEKAFARAVECAPDRAEIRYNHGLLLMQLKRWTQAERVLKETVELEPDSVVYEYALMSYYVTRERWVEAVVCVDRLIELEPDNGRWVVLRGRLLGESGG